MMTQVFSEERSLSVFVFDLKPWSFKTSEGNWSGYYVDLVNALLSEAGFKAEWVAFPWSRALAYMKAGTLDIILNLSWTRDREEFIDYIGVCGNEQISIVMPKSNSPQVFNTLDDFMQPGQIWGIRENVFYSTEFNHRLMNDTEFKRYFDFQPIQFQNMDKLLAGRISGLLGDLNFLRSFMANNPEAGKKLVIITAPFFPPSPIYVGASKQIPAGTRDKLRQAHQTIESKGFIKKFYQKWFLEPVD